MKEFVIILNFETGKIESLVMENRPEDQDADEFIEEVLNYDLSNCQWMVTREVPTIEPLNY